MKDNDYCNENKMNIVERLKAFMMDEARSCSMYFGCITSEFVYRMWGGSVALEEIKMVLRQIKHACR